MDSIPQMTDAALTETDFDSFFDRLASEIACSAGSQEFADDLIAGAALNMRHMHQSLVLARSWKDWRQS